MEGAGQAAMLISALSFLFVLWVPLGESFHLCRLKNLEKFETATGKENLAKSYPEYF